MKTITKGKNMNNFKKVGLSALAGSLAAISANAAEMTVSGASVLTYTTEGPTEVTGNRFGMKTNIGFTASGEVNGYTVSYMQTSADQFAGMSSARLSVDMGDMGTIAFDQGSGSGLATIDDKTPTAAEEIWDGLGTATTYVGGRVGAAGSSGVFNYVNTFGDVSFNGAFRSGAGVKSADGASGGSPSDNGTAWDFALTTDGSNIGLDGFAVGAGYGEADGGDAKDTRPGGDDEHMTAFANYSFGPATIGYQVSNIDLGKAASSDQEATRWGLAVNVNENLSVSYGESSVTYAKPSAVHIDEETSGIAVAYTMGSMKIAGNRNESANIGGAGGSDSMMEIALSFAF